MILLDGTKTSKERLEKLKGLVASVRGNKPALHVIRVGDDPASHVYVSKKVKTCREIGFNSEEHHLPQSAKQGDVEKLIQSLNENPNVHGILLQLPLPSQLDKEALLRTISPKKDVDGFHPYNRGLLVDGYDTFVPCTPLGMMNLLAAYKISLEGKNAVVMGRSAIVGRPMSLLLDKAGATVTVVHSKTKNTRAITSQADILVVAVGKPKLIKSADIKEGAVVLDVGIHRQSDGKLCGDTDFEDIQSKVSAITPVPGGVGPMTICTLLENTWKAFKAI